MVVERVVDVREMPPPLPLQTVLAAVRELAEGEYVAMLHRRNPRPLYPMLAEVGMAHRTIQEGHSSYRVLIWRRDDAAVAAHCGPADSDDGGSCS